MTDSAHHHPDSTLLQRFVAGELPMGVNLAVSSHVDQCGQCQQVIPRLSMAAGEAWVESTAGDEKASTAGLRDIFATIVAQPAPCASQQEELSASTTAGDEAVRLRDRPVRLPRLLDRIARDGLDWKPVANGIHQALIDVDSQTKCEYIYMDPGASVPTHTHLGSEFMLVLDGTIEDGFGKYGIGDFVARHRQDCHGQVTESGCVCLFVTDAPLIFTEGRARLLNPLNRLRHWWSKLLG